MSRNIAVILQAGAETHEGLARALHALLYTKELSERGHSVRLIFDGAGTEWLAQFRHAESDSARRLGSLFDSLKTSGLAYEVCDFCSGAFHVKDKLEGEPMSAKYMDHPSIADLVDENFELLVL